MRYIPAEEILIVHSEIIDQTGGSHGVRDVGLLLSLVERPKTRFAGKELYRGVFKKAAVYFESLVNYHVFVDGNKRTGVAVTARFLFLNAYNLKVTNKQVEKFVLRIVDKNLDLDKIATWLKRNSEKI